MIPRIPVGSVDWAAVRDWAEQAGQPRPSRRKISAGEARSDREPANLRVPDSELNGLAALSVVLKESAREWKS